MTTIDLILKWFLIKKSFVRTYSAFLIILGLSYILIQYFRNLEIKDATFVGLLLGGSFILLFGAIWIHNFFKSEIEEFENQLVESNDEQKTKFYTSLRSIFSVKNLFIGFIYGLALGLIPFLYNLWSDDILLKIFLGLFLFTVNFLTGLALMTLFKIFQFLYFSAKFVQFDLYDVKHLTSFITTLSKRASIIAALYVFFSITSIYFSILPLDFLTIGYSVFAALVILSAYIIPIIPISNKTSQLKNEVLKTISAEIQNEFNSLVGNIGKREPIALEKYENLIEVRKKIAGIQTIPIGLKAVWNSLYIVAITLLPIVLQFVLEKFTN